MHYASAVLRVPTKCVTSTDTGMPENVAEKIVINTFKH